MSRGARTPRGSTRVSRGGALLGSARVSRDGALRGSTRVSRDGALRGSTRASRGARTPRGSGSAERCAKALESPTNEIDRIDNSRDDNLIIFYGFRVNDVLFSNK